MATLGGLPMLAAENEVGATRLLLGMLGEAAAAAEELPISSGSFFCFCCLFCFVFVSFITYNSHHKS